MVGKEIHIEYTAKEIRRRRKELHLTQDDLAEMIYSSHDVISRIERGQKNPDFQLLCMLARALRCTPNDLSPPDYGFEIPVNVSPDQFEALVEIMTKSIEKGFGR